MSTVRPATRDKPYFDNNPVTEKDEPAFSSDKNIMVMAVDTCPNALVMDTSTFFGEMLTKHVFEPLLKGENSEVISRSMVLKDGKREITLVQVDHGGMRSIMQYFDFPIRN